MYWNGVWGPKGLPRHVVEAWNREVNRIVQTPEVKDHLANEGLEPAPGTPEDFAAVLKDEVRRWAEVVRRANIKILE